MWPKLDVKDIVNYHNSLFDADVLLTQPKSSQRLHESTRSGNVTTNSFIAAKRG